MREGSKRCGIKHDEYVWNGGLIEFFADKKHVAKLIKQV